MMSSAHVSAIDMTVSSPWVPGQPVVIIGNNLKGDQPDSKRLCITPENNASQKKCYAETDLSSVSWSDTQISFLPPWDAPTRGSVSLLLRRSNQQCSTTTVWCDTNYSDVEQAVGDFITMPTVTKVIDVTNPSATVQAKDIEPWKVYEVDGIYFGDIKGNLYLRQSRGSLLVPDDKIYNWSPSSIIFASPTNAEMSDGLSVNNTATAQWYDFSASGSSVSSSLSGSSIAVSTGPYADEIRKMKVMGVVNVFTLLQNNQATVDRLVPSVALVGSTTDPVCKSFTFKDSSGMCQDLCARNTENTCSASCADTSKNSSCMIACHSYKAVTDAENSCISSCIKECVAGTQCVCTGGRADVATNRELVDAQNILMAGYVLLYEDKTTDPTLIQDLQWQLQKNNMQLVKKNGRAALVSATSAASNAFFTDVDAATNPYAPAIQWAKDSGISQGNPDGTFKPEKTVNRAELLKLVLSLQKAPLDAATTGTGGFADVQEDAWYAPYVHLAVAKSIVQGYPDGTFKPEQPVNGAEALKIAYIALGIKTADIGGPWYQRFLQHAQTSNILFDSSVHVDTPMKRKDVVWMLWKLMTLQNQSAGSVSQ